MPIQGSADERFRKAFRYPKRYGSAGKGYPYHLDLACLDVIESLPKGSRILEVGCGGAQMRSFLKGSYEYVGVDVSRTRVTADLQAHGGPDLLCDVHDLPFPSESFDTVYTVAVTEHLYWPLQAMQQIHRVLKPGGYYMGNCAFMEPWHDDSYFHLSPLGAFELLRRADFEVLNIWPGKGYHGFGAIMRMGSRVTSMTAKVGDAIYWLYRTQYRLKGGMTIEQAARVAGAIDWIARKA